MINLFQKCEEIYEGIRRHVWYMIPLTGTFLFLKWFILEWLPARAIQAIDGVLTLLPNVTINPATISVQWGRINQFVPFNELLVFGAAYMALAALLTGLRWVRKLLPFA